MKENLKLFNRALNQLNSEYYNESVELFKQYLQGDPMNAYAIYYIGKAQLEQGIIERNKPLLNSAKQHFQKAISFIQLKNRTKFPLAEEGLIIANEELNKLTPIEPSNEGKS